MKSFSENFVVIDLETSGLMPECHSILEVAAVDAAGRRFYRRVAFVRGTTLHGMALQCNGIDPLDLGDGFPVAEVLCDLLAWLRADGYLGRWVMGGKNPQFDYEFLKAYWPEDAAEPLHEVISRRCVDLHSVVYGRALEMGVDMSDADFSTDQLYAAYGMDPEPKPHNALRGVLHEMEGFKRVLLGPSAGTPKVAFDELMRSLERENMRDCLTEGAAN